MTRALSVAYVSGFALKMRPHSKRKSSVWRFRLPRTLPELVHPSLLEVLEVVLDFAT